MCTGKGNNELGNNPLKLAHEEKQDPYEVLQDFYSCFHFQDICEMLWDWLVAAMSTKSGQYITGYARSNLIFVYEKLELRLEATYTMTRRRRTKLQRRNQKWIEA